MHGKLSPRPPESQKHTGNLFIYKKRGDWWNILVWDELFFKYFRRGANNRLSNYNTNN